MTSIKRHINIYTEASPNPNSLKFVFNFLLTPEGKDFHFRTKAEAKDSPLASALFDQFEWIDQVFFLNNFITLTKSSEDNWYELIPEVKPFLTDWTASKKPIFVFSSEGEMQAALLASSPEGKTDIENQIIQLLDEYVRPAVEGDGGAITFNSFVDGVVNLELRGSCSGCPSSTVTLKQGIQNLLTRMVPEVKEVVAVGM